MRLLIIILTFSVHYSIFSQGVEPLHNFQYHKGTLIYQIEYESNKPQAEIHEDIRANIQRIPGLRVMETTGNHYYGVIKDSHIPYRHYGYQDRDLSEHLNRWVNANFHIGVNESGYKVTISSISLSAYRDGYQALHFLLLDRDLNEYRPFAKNVCLLMNKWLQDAFSFE